MPLLPYVNGLMMQVPGFGLFQQRAVNGLWGALTLLLAVRWLARYTRPVWALGFITILSLSALWMSSIHLGKTYALAGLILLAALWGYTEWAPGIRKVSLLALLATIGIGCRLTVAPFFAVIWAAAAAEIPLRQGRTWLLVAGSSLLWPAILLLPFYLAAPEAAYFWTLDFHRLSVPHKPWRISWPMISALAPALWLGLAAGLGHAAITRILPARRELILISATLLALAPNLLFSGVYEEYASPFLPPLALLVGISLWRAGATVRWLRHPMVPVGLLLLNLIAGVALLWPAIPPDRHSSLSVFLPLNTMAYDSSLPGRISRQTMVVRKYLPPAEPFIGPQVILAVEADRPVPHNLRMGPFTATGEYPPALAQRLNLVTFPELEAYLNDPKVPLLAFYKNSFLNYAWSMPSFGNPPEQDRLRWRDILQRDFMVAYEDADSLLLIRKNNLLAEAP
jgi:hypothetical protein